MLGLVSVLFFVFFQNSIERESGLRKKYFVNRELCGFPAKIYYISMVCPQQPQPQLKLYYVYIGPKDVCWEIPIG